MLKLLQSMTCLLLFNIYGNSQPGEKIGNGQEKPIRKGSKYDDRPMMSRTNNDSTLSCIIHWDKGLHCEPALNKGY